MPALVALLELAWIIMLQGIRRARHERRAWLGPIGRVTAAAGRRYTGRRVRWRQRLEIPPNLANEGLLRP